MRFRRILTVEAVWWWMDARRRADRQKGVVPLERGSAGLAVYFGYGYRRWHVS